jgi:hypothetical protein
MEACVTRCSRFSVLCISGLVLVAGCASGKAANHNAGHSASAPASASASATASPTASSSPATVQIGLYTQEFAGSLPTDPAQANVIDGFREAQVLWVKSEQAWHLVAPVTEFVLGDALSHLSRAIAVDKQQGIVLAGGDQFFMTRVTSLSANSATVTTCDNGSKITGVQKATGQIDNAFAPSPNQAYILENWYMVQHSSHWAISSFSLILLPNPRAQSCQP